MLRQLITRGLRVVSVKPTHCSASLGAAGTHELSGLSCLREESAQARWTAPRNNVCSPLLSSSMLDRGLRSPLRKPVLPLAFWRHSAAAAAVVATGPAASSTRIVAKEAKAVAPVSASKAKAKPSAAGSARPKAASAPRKAAASAPHTAAASAPRNGKAASTKAAPSSKAAKAKPRTVRSTNAAPKRKSTTSGTARGHAAAERRRAKAAKAKAKAKGKVKAKAAALRARAKAKKDGERRRAKAKKDGERRAVAKAKAKAKEKEAQRIKRPLTALNIFLREQYQLHSGDKKPLFGEISKRFKELPAAEKDKYVVQAAASKAEVEQRRAKRSADWAAKHSLTPYMLFAKETRPTLRAANPGMLVPDMGKRLGEMWRALSAESRTKYAEIMEADRRAKGLKPLSVAPKP